MGKRSRERMTGLTSKGRIQRSIKRKAEEIRKRKEQAAKLLELMIKGIKRRKENT